MSASMVEQNSVVDSLGDAAVENSSLYRYDGNEGYRNDDVAVVVNSVEVASDTEVNQIAQPNDFEAQPSIGSQQQNEQNYYYDDASYQNVNAETGDIYYRQDDQPYQDQYYYDVENTNVVDQSQQPV